MLEYDFHNSIGYWLCMTSHAYERAIHERLARQGITHRQCQVLAWLALEGEQSQVELAQRMNIEPPTLVRVLDRMERDGLVARVADPDDRRRKMIRPLPKAKPLWKKMVGTFQEVRTEVAADLTERQIATLKSLLDKIQANLAASHGDEPAGDGRRDVVKA